LHRCEGVMPLFSLIPPLLCLVCRIHMGTQNESVPFVPVFLLRNDMMAPPRTKGATACVPVSAEWETMIMEETQRHPGALSPPGS
jgi:hypothetical protein